MIYIFSTIVAICILLLLFTAKKKAPQSKTIKYTFYTLVYIVFQLVAGLFLLLFSQGNWLIASLPSFIFALVIFIRQKDARIRWGGIMITIACFLIILPEGCLSRKTVFTPMPIQRTEYQTEIEDLDSLQNKNNTAKYEYSLSESVLIRNPPSDGTALRDIMLDYFDKAVLNDEQNYTNRSITFYLNTSNTRVFINNEQDPYDFARIYLEDKREYELGDVYTKHKNNQLIKYVSYRTSYSNTYGPFMRTDTLSKTQDLKTQEQ